MMRNRTVLLVAAVAIASVLAVSAAQKQPEKAQFSRTTIDLGVVVSNVERAVKFYTDALGFTKVDEFDVSEQLARDTGLTDGTPFKVQVFALGDDPSATKLKIMSIAGSRPVGNQYIGSSLGFRYLTVFVADLDKALDRLKHNGVSPVKAPYPLGGDSHLILVKDPDGNIIELIGPRP